MNVNSAAVTLLTRSWNLKSYVRIIPEKHQTTPLGIGSSDSRFSSPTGSYLVLYGARNLATALAETIIRDRFEDGGNRQLLLEEIGGRAAVEISTKQSLTLLDTRKGGCLKLGISTEITGAKAHDEAREFSQHVHDRTNLNGILYTSRLTGDDCVVIFERAVVSHLTVQRVVAIEKLKAVETALKALCVELIR